ncbi:similar to Saccharomyces cerevisiae YNL118C DCP2 Catalytic subunit of the Dcp1p-Dcp2p decapping enzyme complex, which removes the 5' cap structure from mRNAs prior to their degradation [Maudiozyma saulgeensis]|uniref:Similar to Saccharomyces cerevisiae YNL118C DCP2 Catalytic subunit of the Dcp1p-Dcp2p decapping enzyme complex, which removes the 5' cap structure from mRNAs prior to their degradation n=1 Tax=Maudiozyma saulgeensis TaxID=1789683 RepID=A0A1X7QY96_9SACH|nr:similar to Saccharomyces cerevisiae YNL118C DCP2 Catalytic subunit of the Dcp1p-Dcp2p decapping enzyme complex, which removes the 5' cap structure from mRNAs prior to their degradation [Kazachstania saulgeensis]
MSLPLRRGLENTTSIDRIIEDLLVRFIINCPPEDLSSVERELFHFEEASWFYTDFIKLMNPNLPKLKIKQLSQLFIKLCPLVWKWKDIKVDQALSKFSKYKKTIPVRGAAIFNKNMTKILLVKGTESDSWSFPRGKISKDEDDINCCIREVKEEIGFDLTDHIDEDQFIERNISGKNYKIFLISNIPEDTVFKPLVRNEIEKIQWMDFKKVSKSLFKNTTHKYKFYLINSMIRPLSMWVRHQRQFKNETQLKSQAEEQLKLLLGITKEEQVDPGRDLLNMLQFNANHGSMNSENMSQNVPITLSGNTMNNIAQLPPFMNTGLQIPMQQFPPQQPQQHPGQLSPQRNQGVMPQGFQPFAPFPFVNNTKLNNNNNLPHFNQMMPQSLLPQGMGMQAPRQMTPQQVNVPLLHPQQPTEQEIPSANSLSKPSFAPSSNDNSRILLNVLNSAPQEPDHRGIFNRVQQPQGLHTNDSKFGNSDSTTLLNILHRKPARSVSPSIVSRTLSNVTSESTNPDLPSPSFSSPDIKRMSKTASSDELDYTDFEASTDSEVEEDLEELENESNGSASFVDKTILEENNMEQGEIPHSDNRSDSVASVIDEALRAPSPFSQKSLVNQTKPSEQVLKPKKFKILKRGESIPPVNNQIEPKIDDGTSLLNMLRKPTHSDDPTNQNENASSDHYNSGKSLLDILKKPSVINDNNESSEKAQRRESNVDSTNNELMNMLRKNSNQHEVESKNMTSESSQHQTSNHDLLNILKAKPTNISNISDISPTNSTMHVNMQPNSEPANSPDLLAMLQKNISTGMAPKLHDSNFQSNLVENSNGSFPPPFGVLPIENSTMEPVSMNQKIENTSNELLDMLKRNTISDQSPPIHDSQIPNVGMTSNQGQDLLNMLRGPRMNRAPVAHQNPSLEFDGTSFNKSPILGMGASHGMNDTNNELLAMLQKGSNQNSQGSNVSEGGNASASAQLLNMLHK